MLFGYSDTHGAKVPLCNYAAHSSPPYHLCNKEPYLTPVAPHGLGEEDLELLVLRQLGRLERHLPLPGPGLGGIVLLLFLLRE